MINLYHHQKIALSYLRTNNAFALFMEQGTGKTFPTLVRLLELLKSKTIDDALVVAPKSTLGAWERDFEKFDESDQLILKSSITLVNYDLVWRRDSFKKPWGAIVLDEAHFIKNRSSKRSQALLKMAVHAKYKYILTGTPISNGQLENIWSLYTFLEVPFSLCLMPSIALPY